MKKRVFIIISAIVILFIMAMLLFSNRNVVLEEDDKNELLSILEIQDAPSFKFLSINSEILGFGDSTECYTLKFELSVEDYNKNNLHYYDGDSPALSDNFITRKDSNTYICSVREWEYHTEERKKIYDEILKLNSKYYGIKALKILANILDTK